MIKIDFMQIIYDHVWFGWYLTSSIDSKGTQIWNHSETLFDSLWPVRRYGVPFPNWWFRIWKKDPSNNDFNNNPNVWCNDDYYD